MDKEVARWFKLILVSCLMVLVLAMFSNANRSGWLGVVLIGAMLLYRGQNLRAIIFVAAMAIVAYFIVVEYGDLKLISFRAKETFNNGSDFYRWQLFTGCFQIGLNNPLLGVSPQLIPQHLARYVGEQKYAPDPHNVFASVWAGTGVISSCAMAWLAWSLWKTPILLTSLKDALRSDKALRMQVTAPHRLLKMLLVLWIFRGTFSREILYSPAFCIGFGLVIGLGITHGMWKSPDRRTLAALAQQPTRR